jgi:hypothetical protein
MAIAQSSRYLLPPNRAILTFGGRERDSAETHPSVPITSFSFYIESLIVIHVFSRLPSHMPLVRPLRHQRIAGAPDLVLLLHILLYLLLLQQIFFCSPVARVIERLHPTNQEANPRTLSIFVSPSLTFLRLTLLAYGRMHSGNFTGVLPKMGRAL